MTAEGPLNTQQISKDPAALKLQLENDLPSALRSCLPRYSRSRRTLERRAATNVFPSPPATSVLNKPIIVAAGQTFTPPKAYTRYNRASGSCNDQAEGGDADAVFLLEEGATLSHVVIGSCAPDHVFFEDVCEDAVTIKQKSGTSRINYGGAKGVTDKVVQHNGGGKVIINSFYVENFGILYRSCGNCGTQYKRSVEINDVWAMSGSELVGINSNYGDTVKIRTTKATSVKTICQRYNGNSNSGEPSKVGSGPDNIYCLYTSSGVTS